jgi:hypothetical protein
MHYRILADLVVLIHLCYIAFSVLGGLLVLRRKWWAYIHIPAVLWAALIEFRGWLCPLTPIENWLRQAGGAAGYKAGFIEHYIVPIIYPSSLTQNMQITLGILVLIINLLIYAWIWHSRAGSDG